MHCKSSLILPLLFLLYMLLAAAYHCPIQAQNKLSNLRVANIAISTDTLQLDSLSIVPFTEKVLLQNENILLDTAWYSLNYTQAQLVLKPLFFQRYPRLKASPDSISVLYRVLPFSLTARRFHKNTDLIVPFGQLPAGNYQYTIRSQTQESSIFDLGGLNYSGSFGRGISFGNSQDLVVNSNFNLQMSGRLNDIEITAAITDNNIPFQPEGNTQQIQEFDRIFIQLKKDKTVLLLGDYDLRRPNSYFMNFSRRLQGVNVQTSFGNDEVTVNAKASGAIARGNYNRMVFNGIEGNQGPYRLLGANGEAFIVVLSGSERVFIDGRQLTRGADQDYIIDYNSAELVFTPNQLITKDKRIVVEFEYADQNYLRSLLYAETELTTKKWRVYSQFFTEQDAKNQLLIDESVPENYRTTLRNIGDDIDNALIASFDSVGFNTDRVMYALNDTTVNGAFYDSIFVYSTNKERAVYALSFSFVGQGNGYYVLSDRSVNGRVYDWVAPDSTTGVLQGNYAPFIKLVTPKRRQLHTVGASYQIAKQQKISVEMAMSNNDINTFSDIDDADDRGISTYINYEGSISLNKEKQSAISTQLQYEMRQQQFTPLEPYRPVEFNRDWNLNNVAEATEHITAASVQWKNKMANIRYQLSSYSRANGIYQGYKQVLHTQYRSPNNWHWQSQVSYLTTQADSLNSSRYLRPRLQLTKTWRKTNWQIGTLIEQEHNRIFSSETKSLNQQSFYFNDMQFFIGKNDSSKTSIEFRYIRRIDYAVLNNKFAVGTVGNTLNMQGALRKNPKNQLSWSISYRQLAVPDTTLSNDRNSNSVLGNVNYNVAIKKGLIRSGIQYQLGTGQQQRTEYYYERIADGTGNFVWVDNGDGVEDLSEFLPATENNQIDAHYIRIILPTGEYQPTNTVQYNQTLSINPKALWFDSKGIKKVMSRFSTQSVLTIRRETINTQRNVQAWLPFAPSISEDLTVSESTNIRNALFFNRNHPKFEANLFQSQLVSQQFLVGGINRRSKQEQGGLLRFNWSKMLSLQAQGSTGFLANRSEAFENQDYYIQYWQTEPSVSFVPNKKIRVSTRFKHKNSLDTLSEINQRAIINKLSADFRYSQAAKRSFDLQFSYVSIQYNGEASTATAYTLLEGLQSGNNFLWAANFNTRLSNNVQLTFSYDGRKTEGNQINHVGRASLRALF